MQYLQKAIRSIPIQVVGLVLFFGLYHKFVVYIMRETSLDLGAVRFNTHLVPLYAELQVDLGWWLLPALVVCLGFLYLCHKYLLAATSPRYLMVIAIVCFIAIHISVAQIDGYREKETEQVLALLEPYTRTSLEYYGDVPRVDEIGVRAFLRDYSKPELFDTLSGHSRTHPPGGVLFLWSISKIFGYNLVSASLLSILFTALTVIPIYRLAVNLYDEKVARYALILFLITPNFVMFTGTSMDGPFSVFPILSVYLFYKAMKRATAGEEGQSLVIPYGANSVRIRIRPYSLLTGVSLALGMFMTYSTVVIGIFICVLTLLEWKRFNEYFKVLLFAGIGFIAFYLLLFLLTGFRPIEALWEAIKKDEAGMGTGYESIGRYFHLSIANLFAFLIGVGLPITVVWLRHLVTTVRAWQQHKTVDTFVIGYLITLLFFTFSTLFTMEVERIWIFMVPFLVIPVAKYLTTRPMSELYWVAGLLVAQLIVGEVLLYTYW